MERREEEEEEKSERTSETLASGSHSHSRQTDTGHGRASRPFLFFQTKCRDNTCVQGSLLTFGNDSPLYGRPSGGAALTDMCVIHTGHSHNTGLQNQGKRRAGAEKACRKAVCQGWKEG